MWRRGPVAPPPSPREPNELIRSQVIPCDRCDEPAVHLIFTADNGTGPGALEDVTRKMFTIVRRLNIPTYAVGATVLIDSTKPVVSDIRQVWPERGELLRVTEKEFDSRIDELTKNHCDRVPASTAGEKKPQKS